MVLDKTGTLTEGKLRLQQLTPLPGFNGSDVLGLAASVESLTTHPLANAIKLAAANEGQPNLNCIDVNEISSQFILLKFTTHCSAELVIKPANNSVTEPGEGVCGVVEGEEVFVGRKSWVERNLGSYILDTQAHGNAQTTVWVGVKGRGLIGSMEFKDTLREDAKQVIKELTQSGKRVVVLSGDDEGVARSIAVAAGVDLANVFGRVKPAGKADFVSQLREKGATVAMVGDGVNDAVALSSADVGIAMGGGTDAAGAAADVVLMGDRLGQTVEALKLGGATLDKIKQNLGLAVIYNIIGIPVAAGALLPSYGIALTPTVAAGMMACSSIIVVTNSLLLRGSAEKST